MLRLRIFKEINYVWVQFFLVVASRKEVLRSRDPEAEADIFADGQELAAGDKVL